MGQALETVVQRVGGGPGRAGGTLRADGARDQRQHPCSFLTSEEMATLGGPLQSLQAQDRPQGSGCPESRGVPSNRQQPCGPWEAQTMRHTDRVSSPCHANNHSHPLLLPGWGVDFQGIAGGSGW